jgi:endonuclease YncB( thermonuclease family)
MANSRCGRSWLSILLIVAAVAIWIYGQPQAARPPERTTVSRTEKPAPSSGTSPSRKSSPAAEKEIIGGYEVYRKCHLAEARKNDGDSFMVNLHDGRKSELRLYHVDTPESAFKSYRGGETNHQRIEEQAAEMGGITAKQAVKVGQDAKHFTLSLLGSQPFDIYTRWDSPFNDERYHAFVQIRQGGKSRWLHELLVEKGFVRIHTKGANLPDGTTYAKQKSHLKDLESTAKKSESGTWGL